MPLLRIGLALAVLCSRVTAEIAGSPYAQKTPWSVLILSSNFSKAGLCSGTAVGTATVLTARHCLEAVDRVMVYSSAAPGGVNASCMLLNAPESMLFRPTSVPSLNARIARCGAVAAVGVQASMAPGDLDAALVRTAADSPPLVPAPLGRHAPSAPVRAFGYGTTTGRQPLRGALFNMQAFVTAPLSDTSCASIAVAMRAPRGQQWVCLPNRNHTICSGDSGGAVMTAAGSATLVAMNVEGAASPRGGACVLSPVTLHASAYQLVPWMNETMATWRDRGLRVAPAPQAAAAPATAVLWVSPTTGSVYLRGVAAGSSRTLWCEGLVIAAHAVVTSAACIGTFVDFMVYDNACAAAVGVHGTAPFCDHASRPARLVAKHPSWAGYAASLAAGAPLGPGVDLALLSTCGAPLAPVAALAAAGSAATAGPPGSQPSAVTFFPAADCAGLTFMFGRPNLACSAADRRISGSPLFAAGGAAALKSLLFYAAGIVGASQSPQPFAVNTQLAPYAAWMAAALSGRTASAFTLKAGRAIYSAAASNATPTCDVAGVPPSSSSTTSSSSEALALLTARAAGG